MAAPKTIENNTMNYILKKYHKNITDKELLFDLRKAAKKLGKRKIGKREYNAAVTYDVSTLSHRFGSWNKAVKKAGLEINKPATNEELMNNLKHVWDTLKRQPSSNEMVKPLSQYSNYAYSWRFGSWFGALVKFVKLHSKKGKHIYRLMRTSMPRKRNKIKIERCVSKSMRFDIMKRDKFKCKLCGASPAVNPKINLHIDHIIPRSKNGSSAPDNLQTLCSDCNYGKSAKSIIR